MFRLTPPHLITSFKQLSKMFVGHFMANKKKSRTLASLCSEVQRLDESLKSYIKKFTIAFANVNDPNKSFFIQAFKAKVVNELFVILQVGIWIC